MILKNQMWILNKQTVDDVAKAKAENKDNK